MRSRSAGLLRATLRQSFVPSKLTGHPFPSSLQSSDDQLSFYFQDTLSSCSVYRVFGRGLASKSNSTVSKWKKYRGDVSGKLTERNDVAKDRSGEGNELHGIEGNIKRQRSRKGKDTPLEEILGIGNEKGSKTAGRKRAGNSHSKEELKIQGRSEKRSKEIEVENAGQRSTKAQAVGKTKEKNAFGVDGQSKSQSALTDNTDLKDANEQIQLNDTAGKEIEEAALSGRSFVVEWTAGKKKKVKKMLVEDLSTMPVEELKVREEVLSEGKPTKKSKKKVSASEKIVKPALVSDEVLHFSQVSKQNGKANEFSPVEISFITQNSTISNLHNVSADFELLSLSSPGPLPHIETSLKAMKSSENSLGLSSSDPGGVISDPESFENRPELMAVVAERDSIPLNNSSNNGLLNNATTVLRTDSISQADNEKHLGDYQVAKLKDLDSNPEFEKLDSKLDFIVENGKSAKLMLENNSEPVRDSKDVTKYSSAIAVLERTLKILRNEDADVLKTSDTMSNSGESMSIETRKERWKSLYREKVERTLLKKGHIASATIEAENCETQSFEGNMETGDHCSVHVSNNPKDEIEQQSRHLGSVSNEETEDKLQSIQELDDANKSMGTSSNEIDHAASLDNQTNMVHGIEAKATMSCCLSGTESTVVSVNTDADGDYADLDTDLNVTSILSNDGDTRVETETSTLDSFEELGKGEVEGERGAEAVAKDGPSDNFISDSDYSDADMDSEAATQAISLLRALDEPDDAEGTIRPEHQHSLRVGIVGAPNAGKSALMNYLVGTKVSAVSRKTNTTRGEILGVLTEGETQLLFYDTPGLTLDLKGQPLRQDAKSRVQNAWMIADHCEVLLVLVDAHRQIERPDSRVRRLISKLGVEERASQKRILCLNKVDLVKQKKSLVPVAQELGNLHGFDQVFMISGLKGGGIKDLKEYLVDQAVLRPWEEQPGTVTDMSPVMMAKEIVWEHILNNLHEELPYELRHEHISWKVLNDGSIRIEQQILVPTESHKKIVVGKHGVMIRRIGMSAHNELNARLGRTVHLFLDVKIYRAGSYISDLQQEFA